MYYKRKTVKFHNFTIVFLLSQIDSFKISHFCRTFLFLKRSNLIYRSRARQKERKQRRRRFFRDYGRLREIPRSCVMHVYPLPYLSPTRDHPPPFRSSPGVVRLPSHRVMTCRLSDLARSKAARFELRNDRHRWPEADEEKDRTKETARISGSERKTRTKRRKKEQE